MSLKQRHRTDGNLWLVDDSQADQLLMRLAFAPHIDKSAIVPHYSAESAVEALDAGAAPSLILLDLNMPGAGGPHLLRYRREHGLFRSPILVMSSSTNPEDVHLAYELGANAFVRKPSNLEDIQSTVEVLHKFWFQCCELP